MLPPSLELAQLDRVRGFRHYFRYPLRDEDFRPLREHARLRGYYAAKPLHGAVTRDGRVDRGSAFNGEVAAVFVPSPARSWRHAQLVLARMDPRQVRRGDGKRNWPAIRDAAERAILARLPPPAP